MEGSKGGQPDTTGDAVEDPFGDMSKVSSTVRGQSTSYISTDISNCSTGPSERGTPGYHTLGDDGGSSRIGQLSTTNAEPNDSGGSTDTLADLIGDNHARSNPPDGNPRADHSDHTGDNTNGGDNNNPNNTHNDGSDGINADTDDNTSNNTNANANTNNTNTDAVSTENKHALGLALDSTGVARISERSSDTIIGSALAIKNSHDPLQPGGGPIDDAHIAEKEPASDEPAKRELKPEDCEDQLGYAYPKWKKWWILTVIFLIQTSMNFNTSLYSNGIPGIAQEFNVSEMASRLGAAIFLLTYAFGCELWAPWSEEFGRKPILQLSLFLTNVWALPVVFAPSFTSVLVGRFLGGLSTAGGSVTLGMIPDLYDSDRQQYAIAYIVFSSVFGSVLGPIIGGFVQTLPPGAAWRWCIWIQVIFGGVVQLLHLITVPETRTTIILDSIAKKRRKANADDNIYGPSEMSPLKSRFSWSELLDTWMRPFKMLIREPIVRKLSLLSGFSDAIIFVQIQAMGLIYKQWNFNSWQIGLTFIPIAIGYFIGWMIFIPQFRSTQRKRELDPFDQWAQYESRLSLMRGLAPLLPVGLLVYAWTSMGPPIHWVCPMIGSVLIGIANYAIYMATIDYMVCAYGPYSASATGGNGFARDLFAGILTMPSTLFYQKISNDGRTYQWASTILGVISAYLVYLACCVYVKGPELRKNSPFAQHLANREEEFEGHHISVAPRPGSVLGAAEAEAAAEAAAETAQDTGRTSAMENRQAPVGSAPVPVPVHTARTDIDVERGSSAVSTRPAFGPASSRGSYMASIQATSRRQSRQASRNTSQNPSRRTSSEVPHDHMGSFSGERLAARLQNLGTIDAVVNES